jgi:hypothetical protein
LLREETPELAGLFPESDDTGLGLAVLVLTDV